MTVCGAIFVSCFAGLAMISTCGNLATLLVGNALWVASLLLIGNAHQPPYMLPFIPVATWVPFVACVPPSMPFHALPCPSMDVHALPWPSLPFHGRPRPSMTFHALPWPSTALSLASTPRRAGAS